MQPEIPQNLKAMLAASQHGGVPPQPGQAKKKASPMKPRAVPTQGPPAGPPNAMMGAGPPSTYGGMFH